jgi:hypothetical protein
VAIATLPGAVLWHEGQFEGRRVHPPVFLSRRPQEPPDTELAGWYRRLVAAVAGPHVRSGTWQLLEAAGWPDNGSCRNLLAWSWSGDDGDGRHIVVVNLSGLPSQGRIPLGLAELAGHRWQLADLLDGRVFERDGDELASTGLYVDLPPWGCHLLALRQPG